MTRVNRLETWYIPEGEQHSVQLPAITVGDDEESQVLVCDDRGDLLCPVYVEEAEHDGLLLLKQFGVSSALIETISAAQQYGDVDPTGRPWHIRRTPTGYKVDEAAVDELGDAM